MSYIIINQLRYFILFFLFLLTGVNKSLLANTSVLFEDAIISYQQRFLLNADILVAKGQQKIFEKHIGYANIAQKKAFKQTTVFPVASLSKQFTAVAALLLQEDNKLDLHQPISRYLPEHHPIWQGNFPFFANIITCHHLLTHSSGLVNYTDNHFVWNINTEEPLKELFLVINKAPLRFTPGSRFEYNNTGFLLLGIIIETISQQSLSQFFKHRLFDKVGMINTTMPTLQEEIKTIQQGFIADDLAYYVANLANRKPQLTQVKCPFTVPLQGGGALYSTQEDLLKWVNGLYQHKILNAKSLDLMVTAHIGVQDPWFGDLNYGYGLFIDNKDDTLLYYHGGWVEGVRAMMCYNPKSQGSVIMLSNVSPDETQAEKQQQIQSKAFNQLAIDLLLQASKL